MSAKQFRGKRNTSMLKESVRACIVAEGVEGVQKKGYRVVKDDVDMMMAVERGVIGAVNRQCCFRAFGCGRIDALGSCWDWKILGDLRPREVSFEVSCLLAPC